METVTLWRPVGPQELDLIRQSGMRAFPPRLPDQPIFYPVTTEEYAVKIARVLQENNDTDALIAETWNQLPQPTRFGHN